MRHVNDAALQAREVDFAYGKGARILHAIDFSISPGEVVGLVGESGCGKSTLGRLLAGMLAPTAGEIVQADDLRPGDVQVVFQDPYSALNPALTPRAAVREVFRTNGRMSRARADQAAVDLLAQVGIEGEAIDRRPRELSGGQCQRVSIGRALAMSPAVLIADEPTSSLDVSVQAQILNLLKELQSVRQLALVLVSHDLDVIRYMADRTYVMRAGVIVENGETSAIYNEPKDAYTQRLVNHVASTQ
jgi:ABC-type dipeptide/oligopeptide/nickel transport system ATPase subunit